MQPYSKGVRLSGHTEIWNPGCNMNLASVDSCAYVSSFPATGPLATMLMGIRAVDHTKDGVAVIDASDPLAPKLVQLLRDKGSSYAAETIHAVSAQGRKVLVAGAYAGGQHPSDPEDTAWLDIYDASDCKAPKLMNEYKWPENVHMVTLSPSGKRA